MHASWTLGVNKSLIMLVYCVKVIVIICTVYRVIMIVVSGQL